MQDGGGGMQVKAIQIVVFAALARSLRAWGTPVPSADRNTKQKASPATGREYTPFGLAENYGADAGHLDTAERRHAATAMLAAQGSAQ
jgi:hypothetical protein